MSSYLDGITIIKAEGYWQGNAEHSLIIELEGTPPEQLIEQIVYEIKKLNKQDRILVQYIESKSKLL